MNMSVVTPEAMRISREESGSVVVIMPDGGRLSTQSVEAILLLELLRAVKDVHSEICYATQNRPI